MYALFMHKYSLKYFKYSMQFFCLKKFSKITFLLGGHWSCPLININDLILLYEYQNFHIIWKYHNEIWYLI